MKLLVYVVISIALLCGLFVLFKPDTPRSPAMTTAASPSSSSRSASSTTPTSSQAGPVSEPGATLPERSDAQTSVDLVIAQGKLVSGPTVVTIRQGSRVVFHVTSDVEDELHLHGYNLHVALKPGVVATLELHASRAGRFTYELHRLDQEIGALEVYPG